MAGWANGKLFINYQKSPHEVAESLAFFVGGTSQGRICRYCARFQGDRSIAAHDPALDCAKEDRSCSDRRKAPGGPALTKEISQASSPFLGGQRKARRMSAETRSAIHDICVCCAILLTSICRCDQAAERTKRTVNEGARHAKRRDQRPGETGIGPIRTGAAQDRSAAHRRAL